MPTSAAQRAAKGPPKPRSQDGARRCCGGGGGGSARPARTSLRRSAVATSSCCAFTRRRGDDQDGAGAQRMAVREGAGVPRPSFRGAGVGARADVCDWRLRQRIPFGAPSGGATGGLAEFEAGEAELDARMQAPRAGFEHICNQDS